MANFGMIGGGLVVSETIDKSNEIIITDVASGTYTRVQCYKTGRQCHFSCYIASESSARNIQIEFPSDMHPTVNVDFLGWMYYNNDTQIARASIVPSSNKTDIINVPANYTFATNLDWISEY